jgi:Integrase core domain
VLRFRRLGMNSIMERWVGSCRRELLDRTLVWNQRHLMIVLREYEDFYNTHRPHRALNQAAPLRQLPDGIPDLDQFRVQRRDRAGGRDSRISPGRVGFRHPQVRVAGAERAGGLDVICEHHPPAHRSEAPQHSEGNHRLTLPVVYDTIDG